MRRAALLPQGAQSLPLDNLTSPSVSESSATSTFEFDGKTFRPRQRRLENDTERAWNGSACADRFEPDGDTASLRTLFLDDFPASPINNIWMDTGIGGFADDKSYVVQTIDEGHRALPPDDHRPRRPRARPDLRQRHHGLCRRAVGPALDHLDTSRVALALARTRLMAAKYPYYLLADSPEGIKKEAELTGKMPPELQDRTTTSARALSTSACRTSRSRSSPTTRTSRKA